ncbi:integrase core domain-containing protein [Kitasatospora indigofera]|uniref:integrase core domain-containing protein n=1 Tax=Kitasatospora indigofera TaxID=67307 RepID=UPI003677374C
MPSGRRRLEREQRRRGNLERDHETRDAPRTKGWSSEREARLELFRWLHRYNTVRRHTRLGHRSPITYENALNTTSTTLAQAA